ncbi:unnamed protein product [Victoria cruziana]
MIPREILSNGCPVHDFCRLIINITQLAGHAELPSNQGKYPAGALAHARRTHTHSSACHQFIEDCNFLLRVPNAKNKQAIDRSNSKHASSIRPHGISAAYAALYSEMVQLNSAIEFHEEKLGCIDRKCAICTNYLISRVDLFLVQWVLNECGFSKAELQSNLRFQ